MKRTLTASLLAAFAAAFVAPQTDAALISDHTTVLVSTSDRKTTDVDVSLYPGTAGYDGSISGTFGDGTVLDYRLVNNPGGTFSGTGYANGGGNRVGVMTSTGSVNTVDYKKLNVWTTNDPGTESSNFSGNGILALASGVTGDIDISGLASGTVYFIHGTYQDNVELSVSMTGSGQPDLNKSFVSGSVSGHETWVTSFTFDNAGDSYDTISFSYLNSDSDASGARFAGVVIDGVVPEPGSLALLGLGGLCMLRRRRMAM